MKKFFKLFGIVTLVAIIGFSMTALSLTGCDTSTGPSTKPNPDTVPTVTSVTISPKTPNVVKGNTITFTATVEGTNNPKQTVTWSIVETGKNAGTAINASGVLTVAAAETLTTLTVMATSTVDKTKSDTATVSIYGSEAELPTITSVTVSPPTVTVGKGSTHTFTAAVAGTNSPAETVTWSIVEAGKKAGTTISASGVLTVAADEALTTLTVKATSTVDDTKSGTAAVTVSSDPSILPTITGVTVSPSTANVAKGATQTFTVIVTGTNSPAQTVTWSIVETGKKAGTTINASGVLTVAADEALTTLTVKATSTVDTSKSGTATVTISTPENPPVVGSGQYTKKDVLSNSYSISVGSSVPRASVPARYARAAMKDDSFKMSVKGRNGNTRNVSGKVKNISTDGTLTLKTDKGEEFTAVVNGNNLGSIASDGAEITFDDNSKLVPRTFDTIFLRADRWDTGNQRGEQYGSGLSVLVKDFPTNVSRFEKTAPNGRYEIKVSGTIDKALSHAQVEVHGLNENDDWIFLAQNYESISISTGNFDTTIKLDVDDDPYNTGKSYNLMDYKEVILQFVERVNYTNDDHSEWNQNYGTIPDDIPNGQIWATVSNFNIVLKDTTKEALKGNVSDYTYGFREDGFTIDYRQAVWSLSATNIADAKKTGAKFEFTMLEVDDILNPGTSLHFSWQDPVQELWWQEETNISEWDEVNECWYLADGVTWNSRYKIVSIDLSKFIKDARFKNSTKLNFIVGCYWNDGKTCKLIDDVDIAGVNIVVPPQIAGNMGACNYGYQEDGITTHYKQAVWHLPEAILTTAKSPDARLEIVFNNDITSRAQYPTLALVWQDTVGAGRWWPTSDEEGKDAVNLRVLQGEFGRSGVTYDSSSKKLTVILENALETYNDPDGSGSRIGFVDSTDVNFVLDCWWGVDANINELGIVSANIVTQSGTGAFEPYNDSPNLPNFSSPKSYNVVNEDGRTNVLKVVNPSGTGDEWAVAVYDLAPFKGKEVEITFSADVKRTGSTGNLVWQINNADTYPTVGEQINNAAVDTWHPMSGTLTVTPTDDYPKIYLSAYNNNSGTTIFYVDNFRVTILEP